MLRGVCGWSLGAVAAREMDAAPESAAAALQARQKQLESTAANTLTLS